jgi:hypothetical protein
VTSRSTRSSLLAVLVLAIAAACTSGGSSPSPAASPAPSVARPSVAKPTLAPTVAPSAPAPVSAPASASDLGSPSGPPSVTTIDWGVIWDALPSGFPSYPGSHPTVTGGGPASALLDEPGEAVAVSTWFQSALKAAGWAIVGANGPREDGSYDIVATRGSPDCQTEISLAPLGATTTATIYYSADCPFS